MGAAVKFGTSILLALICSGAPAYSQEQPSAATQNYALDLPKLLQSSPNDYVRAIQKALIGRGDYQGQVNGLLTQNTITGIGRFCRSTDILAVCRVGIMTEEAATEIGSALDAAGVGRVGTESAPGQEITIDLTCGPEGSGFTRQIPATLNNGTLTVSRGADGENGFESWQGVVAENDPFQVTGTYIEGEGGTKPVDFEAANQGDVISGRGKRGPRDCTFTAQ
jgi:hypothetical protein